MECEWRSKVQLQGSGFTVCVALQYCNVTCYNFSDNFFPSDLRLKSIKSEIWQFIWYETWKWFDLSSLGLSISLTSAIVGASTLFKFLRQIPIFLHKWTLHRSPQKVFSCDLVYGDPTTNQIRCDFKNDCPDKSDESGCRKVKLTFLSLTIASSSSPSLEPHSLSLICPIVLYM